MITNLNNLMGTKATGSELTPLVEQLAKRADVNGDGQVSAGEFSEFLTGLLESLSGARLVGAGVSNGGAKTGGAFLPDAASAAEPAGIPGQPGHMTGWNSVKWNNPEHQTPKYVVGRLLAPHPPTPQGLRDALPSIQQAIPGTTQIGDDKLDIPGVGIVDVGLRFSSGGGVGWWWGNVE